MIFLFTIIGALITFPRLEQRSQDEIQKLFDWAYASYNLPYVEGQSYNETKCDALGSMSQYQIEDGLKRINFYRKLVGLEDYNVGYNKQREDSTMQCARAMSLCNKLTHEPIKDGCTKCVSQDADTACGQSNIYINSNGWFGIPDGVDNFMDDSDGGNTKVGHRRWLLYPTLGNVSFGIGGKFGAVRVMGMPGNTNTKNLNNPFVAYPAPGPFPSSLINTRFSFSLPRDGLINVKTISAVIKADGVEVPNTGRMWNNGNGYLGDSTFTMDITYNNLVEIIRKAKNILITITVDNGNTYQYNVKPFDAAELYFCLCGLCADSRECLNVCPKGMNIIWLQGKDIFTGESVRAAAHNAAVIASQKNKEIRMFSVGQNARNFNPIRFEMDDLNRANITFYGGAQYQYLTLYPTSSGRADPDKNKRKTSFTLKTMILSDGTKLGGQYVNFPVSFHHLKVNFESAVQLPSLNVESVTLLGEREITKINLLSNGKIEAFNRNGKSVSFQGKVNSGAKLLGTNPVPFSLETRSNVLEVSVSADVLLVPNVDIKFTGEDSSKKTIRVTGNWASVKNPKSVKISANEGAIELISKGENPSFDVIGEIETTTNNIFTTKTTNAIPTHTNEAIDSSDPEKSNIIEGDESSEDAEKKLKGKGISGGAVAAIVIVCIVVISAVIIGLLVYLKKIPIPQFLTNKPENSKNNEAVDIKEDEAHNEENRKTDV